MSSDNPVSAIFSGF
uniref:Uncharacterized protein n=1 Tax=Arundo donax TaxID=35708 RepID=A0A0A9AF43_ARUDO